MQRDQAVKAAREEEDDLGFARPASRWAATRAIPPDYADRLCRIKIH
jgi:hypothetical protein